MGVEALATTTAMGRIGVLFNVVHRLGMLCDALVGVSSQQSAGWGGGEG